MLDALTPAEFDEWIAYDSLEPFGEGRADLRSALAASALCNAWGAETEPADFMPYLERDDENALGAEDDALLAAKLEHVFTLHNAAAQAAHNT